MDYKIKEIPSNKTRHLRKVVLRPHQEENELFYPGDDDKLTFHLGLFINEEIISVISVYNESKPNSENITHWRIRGMATLENFRGKGLGQKLINESENIIRKNNGKLIWCNARVSAMEFYKKSGFYTVGDIFEIEGIGPHFVMEKILN